MKFKFFNRRPPRILPSLLLALGLGRSAIAEGRSGATIPAPLPWDQIAVRGELGVRLARNFDRLEEPFYQPDSDFPTLKESGDWPGDKEGRVVLGLTLDAQATHREPKYLAEILRRYPSKFNAQGYFGNVCPTNMADEQQLSGHGWVLRALSEYYLWKKDARCLQWINRILDNLALPTGPLQSSYPIDPAQRVPGGSVSGTLARHIGPWVVSTDVGCDFIFLDGLVQAYQITGRPDVKAIIDQMVQRYQQMDPQTMRAQTHATLTGLRALLRYYALTRDPALLAIVESRFALYRRHALTENYENYNWFGRPAWTEPCAVIDSYQVAMTLWQWTGKPDYAEVAERIYYNGIAFGQRANGGFGTQKCSGAGTPLLGVDGQEAAQCCTMRGGEGLPRVVQALCYQLPTGLDFVHFNDATLAADFAAHGQLRLQEASDYPFGEVVHLTVLASSLDFTPTLQFFAPTWMAQPQLRVNGAPVAARVRNGFLTLQVLLHAGDVLDYSFTLNAGAMPATGPLAAEGYRKLTYGPLLLTCSPDANPVLPDRPCITRTSDRQFHVAGLPEAFGTVYHLLDPQVNAYAHYQARILFRATAGTASNEAPWHLATDQPPCH